MTSGGLSINIVVPKNLLLNGKGKLTVVSTTQNILNKKTNNAKPRETKVNARGLIALIHLVQVAMRDYIIIAPSVEVNVSATHCNKS